MVMSRGSQMQRGYPYLSSSSSIASRASASLGGRWQREDLRTQLPRTSTPLLHSFGHEGQRSEALKDRFQGHLFKYVTCHALPTS
jgi:hypothetical protein